MEVYECYSSKFQSFNVKVTNRLNFDSLGIRQALSIQSKSRAMGGWQGYSSQSGWHTIFMEHVSTTSMIASPVENTEVQCKKLSWTERLKQKHNKSNTAI